MRNTTLREPTDSILIKSEEAKVKMIQVDFIQPDSTYPLIWHIKEMISK